MNKILTQLMGLEKFQLGQENLYLGWERPLPSWAWFLIVLSALGLAIWSYSKMEGPRWWRTTLGTVRGLIIVVLAVLIAGPQVVEREERIEQDWVLVLVDRSASMTIEDAGRKPGERRSRETQLREALQDSMPMWERVAAKKQVLWMGFDGGAYELPTDNKEPAPGGAEGNFGEPLLEDPNGQRTQLGAAIDQSLRRAAGRQLSAVVVLTDGRSLDEPSRTALQRLRQENAPVFVVPLGSDEPIGDIAIRRVTAPDVAFVEDFAPVVVELERTGGASGSATVRLIDTTTGRELATESVDFSLLEETQRTKKVLLTYQPELTGEAIWRVEVEPNSIDLITENNTQDFGIKIVDTPIKVLYIDGYPRWEYRYLKAILLREKSVLSNNLLLARDRTFLQEQSPTVSKLEILPESVKDWAAYDVVILGDVDPAVFTSKMVAGLQEAVAERGVGLMWVGGPAFTPKQWIAGRNPLNALLPFTMRASDGVAVHKEPVLVKPTEQADLFGVLRLGPDADNPWPEELINAEQEWPLMRYMQDIATSDIKPTAQILAEAVPVTDNYEAPENATPMVLTMQYGAGRVIYNATEEIWRWRFGLGEYYPERYWVQLVRMLARERMARSDNAASLEFSETYPQVGQPVRLTIELFNEEMMELGLRTVKVKLQREQGIGENFVVPPVEITLTAEEDKSRLFGATWMPGASGKWIATPEDASLIGLGLEAVATVTLPDDELRRPETNHEMLRELALTTGGREVAPDELASLEREFPNRAEIIPLEGVEPLWDTPLALLLMMFLLSFEWVGRRLIRLL